MAVAPANADIALFGGGAMFEYVAGTSNGGWLNNGGWLDHFGHADIRALEFGPDGTVYMGTDGGIISWPFDPANPTDISRATQLNDGLQLGEFYRISIGQSGLLAGGMQDNGTAIHNIYANDQTWLQIGDGDGGATLTDPSNPANILFQYFTLTKFGQTTTGNDSVGDASIPWPSGGETNRWILPFANRRYSYGWSELGDVGTTWYLGYHQLFTTRDLRTWQYLSDANITTTSELSWAWNSWPQRIAPDAHISAIAVRESENSLLSPSSLPNLELYVAWSPSSAHNDAAIAVSHDAGEHWTIVPLPSEFSDNTVVKIAVGPPNNIALLLTGAAPAHVVIGSMWEPYVTRTVDWTCELAGGSSCPSVTERVFPRPHPWDDVTGNLPPRTHIDAGAYAYLNGDPRFTGLLWVGDKLLVSMEEGVFGTTVVPNYNSGGFSPGNWAKVGSGLPNTLVTDLVADPTGHVVVGTYGRGVWQLDATLPTGDCLAAAALGICDVSQICLEEVDEGPICAPKCDIGTSPTRLGECLPPADSCNDCFANSRPCSFLPGFGNYCGCPPYQATDSSGQGCVNEAP